MTYTLIALWLLGLLIADHLSGTAFYQNGNATMFNDDQFDIFPADLDDADILDDAELAELDETIDDAINAWFDDEPSAAVAYFFGDIDLDDYELAQRLYED